MYPVLLSLKDLHPNMFGNDNSYVSYLSLVDSLSHSFRSLSPLINSSPFSLYHILGTYGTKPTLPSVPGNEGVAVVRGLGSQVSKFQLNDFIVPASAGVGMWRDYGVFEEDQFEGIGRRDIDIQHMACLSVNPCTAWRMIKDFSRLERGRDI